MDSSQANVKNVIRRRTEKKLASRKSETQNNNKITRSLKKSLKKFFLCKRQKNFSHQLQVESNETPLANMENIISRRTAIKCKPQKKNNLSNALNSNKENV